MSSMIVPMPVTIEQVAAAVRHMSRDEKQRLLELVPELQETTSRPLSRSLLTDQSVVEALRQEIVAALDGRLLTPDDPFLDNLTLGDYLDLPDADRARLWDKLAADKAVSWGEVDVHADALPAR